MAHEGIFLSGDNGQGVMLVHGLTGAPVEMAAIAKSLHKQGYTVYCPVLAGHCEGLEPLLATGWEDWVKSLEIALDKFPDSVTSIHAAGICVGGALALYTAAANPGRIKSVAIYSPALKYDGWNSPWYFSLASWAAPLASRMPVLRHLAFAEASPFGIKNERIRAAIARQLSEHAGGLLDKFPLKALTDTERLNKALLKLLPSIKIPTLLIHSRQDDLCHYRNALKLQDKLGAQSEVILINNSYHLIHLDQERQKVADHTAHFFKKHAA